MILITGGTGFIGKNLQKISDENFIFVSSKDVDLKDVKSTMEYFDRFIDGDSSVINLAAVVGGIKFNTDNQRKLLYDNIEIQKNIFENCRRKNVKKIVSSLSTCVMPDLANYPARIGYTYPMYEYDLRVASPPDSNAGYAYAKKLLLFESDYTNNNSDVKSITFVPSNVYGPYDNFDNDDAHFVSAMIRKVSALKEGETLEVWGTGKEMRQQLYVEDLCRAIIILLDNYEDGNVPIIISPDENLTIEHMTSAIIQALGKNNKTGYVKKYAGQIRKDASNGLFKSLYPDFTFTDFETGIEKTYMWYKENYK
jgi:GDP-L-fucose synthase